MIGLGLSIPALALAGRRDPRAFLGAAALGYRDAAVLPSLELSGSNVTSWTDLINGGVASQATSGAKPLWSASGLNGMPSVLFDGIDDYLEQAAHSYPTGQFEIWTLLDNSALPADTTSRWAVGFGTSAPAGIGRGVSSGVNRARGIAGAGAANNAFVDLTGPHIVRLRVEAGQATISVDGGPGSAVSIGAVGSGRLRIGSRADSTPGQFWNGSIAVHLVTTLLSSALEAETLRWIQVRGRLA